VPPVSGILGHDAGDRLLVTGDTRHGEPVRDDRSRIRRRMQQGEDEALAAVDLRIHQRTPPRPRSPRPGTNPAASLAPRTAARPAGAAVGTSREEEAGRGHAQGEGRPAMHPPARGQGQETQRADESGGDGHERPPLARRLAQSRDVEPLQVAQAAVDRLQAVPGGAGAEIVGFQEADAEAARGRLPGRGRPVDPSSHDDDVVRAVGQGVEVAAEHGGR
jgi:hypothetical protein